MATQTIKLLLVLMACGWSAPVHAQYDRNENKVWIFGAKAGIDFNGPVPVTFTSDIGTTTGGTSASQEGSATLADVNGNLLFHTEGTRVWDVTGAQMPNGSNILGFNGSFGGASFTPTYSTTQSSVICPVPDSVGQYFIFSLTDVNNAAANASRLYCNKVKMGLNGGLGDIDINFPLRYMAIDHSLTEKMTLVAGPCFTWLLVYSKDTNSFRAHRITKDGVSPDPVISYAGNFAQVGYGAGTLKVSPDGKRLVNALFQPGRLFAAGLELYDFDYETGVVSNARTVDSMVSYYAAEFSPDNSKLYAMQNGTNSELCQFDLSNPDGDSIRSSRFPLGVCSNTGDIRLAPDGKIYFPRVFIPGYREGNRALNTIENPNEKGTRASYRDSAIVLPEGTGIMIGFPNVAVVEHRPEVLTRLAMDTAICPWLDSLVLTTPDQSTGHIWHTGAADSVLSITEEGVYYVSYTDRFTCQRTDTFRIKEEDAPRYRVALDTLLCPRFGAINLFPDRGSRDHMWSTGASAGTVTITEDGIYHVSYITDEGCSAADTFKMQPHDFPVWSITVRENVLGASHLFDSYQWFKDGTPVPGARDSTYIVTANATYSLVVEYGVCTDTAAYWVNNVHVKEPKAYAPRIYPNPASGLVHIDTELPVCVTLYDMGGRLVLTADNVRILDISALPGGAYFLQVREPYTGRFHRQLLVRAE